MYLRLSHTLDPEMPVYNGGVYGGGFSSKPFLSMTKGDMANAYHFTMLNHVGTHLDAPDHFLNNKRTVDSYDISAFIFENPVLVDIPKSDSELISSRDIEKVERKFTGRDLVLIRTGFGDLRLKDKKRYESSSPGFSAEAAQYLQKFPELRALGFDFISLNTPKFQEDGQRAHKILLAKEIKSGFFIIEDMNLGSDLKSFKRVIVAPLYIRGFDGAPCTVIAET